MQHSIMTLNHKVNENCGTDVPNWPDCIGSDGQREGTVEELQNINNEQGCWFLTSRLCASQSSQVRI